MQLLEKFRLADALDEGAPEGSLPYLQLLAEVLEDGVLDDDERAALRDLANIYSLADADTEFEQGRHGLRRVGPDRLIELEARQVVFAV